MFLTVVSYILIAVTFPISVFMCIKVGQAIEKTCANDECDRWYRSMSGR